MLTGCWTVSWVASPDFERIERRRSSGSDVKSERLCLPLFGIVYQQE